jgi:hypothetical protein
MTRPNTTYSAQFYQIPEWVKLIAVILLLAAAVFITYHLTSTRQPLDTSVQDGKIAKADRKSKSAAKASKAILEAVSELTTPVREQEYETAITESNEEAKIAIDSISILGFDDQAIYWSTEVTRISAIQWEYQGSD